MNVVLSIPPDEIRAAMADFFAEMRADIRAELAVGRREAIRELLCDEEIRALLTEEILHELRLPAGGIRDLVGVSERTLRRWTDKGRLSASPEDLPGPPLYRVGDVLTLTAARRPAVPKPEETNGYGPTLNPLEVLAGHTARTRKTKATRA